MGLGYRYSLERDRVFEWMDWTSASIFLLIRDSLDVLGE